MPQDGTTGSFFQGIKQGSGWHEGNPDSKAVSWVYLGYKRTVFGKGGKHMQVGHKTSTKFHGFRQCSEGIKGDATEELDMLFRHHRNICVLRVEAAPYCHIYMQHGQETTIRAILNVMDNVRCARRLHHNGLTGLDIVLMATLNKVVQIYRLVSTGNNHYPRIMLRIKTYSRAITPLT